MSERIIKWGFIGCGEVTKYKSGPAFPENRELRSSGRHEPKWRQGQNLRQGKRDS